MGSTDSISPAAAAWTDEWFHRCENAPAEARRELLARLVTGLREDGADPLPTQQAAACVTACRDVLDLEDAEQVDLLSTLVYQLDATDDRALCLLRRIDSECRHVDLRRHARMKLAIAYAMRQGHGEAAVLFRTLAAEAGGEDSAFEVRALVNLATAYSNLHRYVEALAALNRAEQVLSRLDSPLGLVHTLLRRAQVLASLGDVDRSAAIDRRVQQLVDGPLAESGDRATAVAALREQISRRLVRDEVDEARLLLERMDELSDPARLAPYYRGLRRTAEVEILRRSGELDAVEEPLRDLEALSRDWPPLEMVAVCARAEFEVARGEIATGRAAIRHALSVLAASGQRGCGWSNVLDRSRRMVRRAREIGDDGLASEALDLAATASLERVREIDMALDAEPDLAEVSDDDRAVLAASRIRFLAENRELCRRIARRVEEGADDLSVWTRRRLTAHDGATVVCAWCQQMQAADGRWLPIGHLVSSGGDLRVTHGMCEPCETALRP